MKASTDSIARYYDHNTSRFLRLGGGGGAAAIHRQVWAPGVENTEQAFLYLNRLVTQAIEPAMPGPTSGARALDLGCGVGGTATWLAQNTSWSVAGVTNSPVQFQLAVDRASKLGLQDRCQFFTADFLNLPDVGTFHAAYAIESFAHAADAGRFFTQVAQRLHPGGRLVICDDFLSSPPASTQASPKARKWVTRFMEGWHINQLLTVGQVRELAGSAGLRLVEGHDLTSHLRFFHPLLLGMVNLIAWLPLRSTYWQNLRGGAALQVCAQNGWTQYHALVLEKASRVGAS